MTAGSPFGFGSLPQVSPEDLAALMRRAPLGPAQSFTGGGPAIAMDEAQAQQLERGMGMTPGAPEPRTVPLPPARPLTFGAIGAPAPSPDMPAPSAVPASGQMPAAVAAPAATAPASAEPWLGDRLGSGLDTFRKNGGFDLLGNIGIGLMSTHGFGNGLAAGLRLDQDAQTKRAATDLARAEYGLKARKLAQETVSENQTAKLISGKLGIPLEQATAFAGNADFVNSFLRNSYGMPEGYTRAQDGSLAPVPGGEKDPATIRARAQAQAEGAAAGKPDDPKLVDVPQPDGTTVKTWLKPGESAGQAVGVPEASTTANEAVKQQQRRQGVINAGKDPNDPRYADYILSGSLPKETQQLLTASDKKAIMEGEDTILAHKNTIVQLNRALDLSKKAYDGAGAGMRAFAVSNIPAMLGGNTPESLATRELNNVVTGQALDNLKATFGGAPTEGERAILLQVQGSADQPQALREQIFRNAIAKVQQKHDFEQQRVDQLRGGTYYKPGSGGQPGATPNGAQRFRFDPNTGGLN